jgi:hypothetical protein
MNNYALASAGCRAARQSWLRRPPPATCPTCKSIHFPTVRLCGSPPSQRVIQAIAIPQPFRQMKWIAAVGGGRPKPNLQPTQKRHRGNSPASFGQLCMRFEYCIRQTVSLVNGLAATTSCRPTCVCHELPSSPAALSLQPRRRFATRQTTGQGTLSTFPHQAWQPYRKSVQRSTSGRNS